MPTTVSVNPHYLIQKAIESGNVDAIERMVALTERLQAEWARKQYFAALAKFQKECPIIERSSKVDFTSARTSNRVNYNYAPMDVLLTAKNDAGETIQLLLEKHGFSYETKTRQTEKDVTAILVSHHRDGHSESTEFTVGIDFDSYMSPPQRIRSARTYAVRTAFEDAWGLVTANPDDDGNAGATEESRANLKPGESEVVAGSVPQTFWTARRKGASEERLQAILVEAFGPAIRYFTRKTEEGWKAIKVEAASADMTETLKESIKDMKSRTPKGEAHPDFHKEKQEMFPRIVTLLDTNLTAGFLTAEEVSAAKARWNLAQTVEDLASIYAEYKNKADNRSLEKV